MNVKDLLIAFSELPEEDRATLRAEIMPKETEAGCCSTEMKERLSGMMKQLEDSENPMAMCMEMMHMCQEKMSAGKAC